MVFPIGDIGKTDSWGFQRVPEGILHGERTRSGVLRRCYACAGRRPRADSYKRKGSIVMSMKRKDKSGVILKTGESQRKDGRYMFRYPDIHGNRQCVYALTLDELRDKEKVIQRDLDDGIDYAAGEITVLELVERYTSQKKNVRYNTQIGYQFAAKVLEGKNLGYKQVKNVKPSDGKSFFIELHDDGYKYGTIKRVRSVLHPAFEMAVEDDIVRKNPFSFQLEDIIPNDSVPKKPLTLEEQGRFLSYVQEGTYWNKYYDEIVILLGTGLRISELYGLTRSDIDFGEGTIHVVRQLQRTRNCKYYISPPKTSSGERDIPMSQEVYQAFQRVIHNRKTPKVEIVVDGCAGFLFLDRDGKPKVALHMENAMKRMTDSYNKTHADKLVVTPHVLRHTFSTNMAGANMNWKGLQYIMGHAKMQITADVYTHSSYEMAASEMRRVENSMARA